MKRNSLAVFVVFTDDGVIDDYVIYLAEQIRRIVKTLVITINGELQEAMKKKLNSCSDHVFVRENEGFDCGAYKETLENYLGWDKVRKYEEVILLNDSCYGPIYPLEPIFEQMDSRRLDFWGITEQIPIKAGNYSNTLLPYHVQTYFVVITKRMLLSRDFSKFWESVELSNGYDDTVANFELKFTGYFNARGYISGAYVDCSAFCKSVDETQAYVFMNSFRLISEHGCPFLKKKVFLYPHDLVLSSNMGETAYKTLEYVKEKTSYKEDLILRHLIRKCEPKELGISLHNNFCLSTGEQEREDILCEKVLLVIRGKEQNLNRKCRDYLRETPSFVDIRYWEQDSNVEKYAYVCYLNIQEREDESLTLFWENLIATPVYIKNVLNLFQKNPRVGVLAPPKPYHAQYFSERYTKNTTYPYGSMFWCRGEVFQKLIENKEWYKKDSVIQNLPMIAKKEGYMCGLVMNEEYASAYTSNYHYMLSGLVKNILMDRGIEEFKNIRKINSQLIEFCDAYDRIYIYGAGECGRECKFYLQLHGIKIDGYIVSDGRRDSNIDDKMDIFELSEISKEENAGIIIAMGKASACSIEKILCERGFTEYVRYED